MRDILRMMSEIQWDQEPDRSIKYPFPECDDEWHEREITTTTDKDRSMDESTLITSDERLSDRLSPCDVMVRIFLYFLIICISEMESCPIIRTPVEKYRKTDHRSDHDP